MAEVRSSPQGSARPVDTPSGPVSLSFRAGGAGAADPDRRRLADHALAARLRARGARPAGQDHRGRQRLRGAARAAADRLRPDPDRHQHARHQRTRAGVVRQEQRRLPLDPAGDRLDRRLRARSRQGSASRRRRVPRSSPSPRRRCGRSPRICSTDRGGTGSATWPADRARAVLAARRTRSSSPRPRRSSTACARTSPT